MPKAEFACEICNLPTFIEWEPPTVRHLLNFTTGCTHAGDEAFKLTGNQRWLEFAQPNHDTKGKQ